MRVLVTGWPSFVDGEATAGDVLSMSAVALQLGSAGIAYDLAYSPVLRPDGLSLADADPDWYTHLVFACGPVYGPQVTALHQRYARCRRVAVGVSVVDPADPAAAGFDVLLARDGAGPPHPDLSALTRTGPVPVVGVVLAGDQPEYAGGRHAAVTDRLTRWVNAHDCAPVPCDTRLDGADWRHCATADQVVALLRRFDLVVTTRLHGLVLALRQGVPALAVDPVVGGAKVSAQARVLGWPACLSADELGETALERWWQWCLSGPGRASAASVAARPLPADQLSELLTAVRASRAVS